MVKAVWISYDLNLKGDYNGLYAWLDAHKAIECGNSVAFLRYRATDVKNLKSNIKKELTKAVKFGSNDRVYMIYLTSEGKISGSFIVGNRKASPWEGYSPSAENIEDSE